MYRMLMALLAAVPLFAHALPPPTPDQLAGAFHDKVKRRQEVPAEVERQYLGTALGMLQAKGAALDRTQLLTVVDRSPQVQSLLLFVGDQAQGWKLVGASPVSTGQTRRHDHYITPTGVYDHDPRGYSDFRAEGSKNDQGVRGYGRRGMRVWDLGWFTAVKGWGKGESGPVRLQMHATDPDLLESRLGQPASKGCIRLSGPLNEFLDHYGALDRAIEEAAPPGKRPWVLRADRDTTLAGRYLVVLDSMTDKRPDWAALPQVRSAKRAATRPAPAPQAP